MLKKRRFLSFAFALVFLFIILFSSLFVVFESNHDCDGESCTICVFINECITNFSRFQSDFKVAVLLLAVALFTTFCIAEICSLILSNTPISLKDKISC